MRLPEVLLIEPDMYQDARGFFYESYHVDRYKSHGVLRPLVQDNISRSSREVIRGLHLQYPRGQGKLVSVLHGRVLDVAVDVRLGSPTFSQYVAMELTDENRRQMWVPRGFAHGFLVLSEWADLFYKCDEYYSPSDEIVIRWNDPAINIDWGIDKPCLAARDANAPLLADVHGLPPYESL